MKCPICNSINIKKLFKVAEQDIFKCLNCGVGFWKFWKMDNDYFESFYNKYYSKRESWGKVITGDYYLLEESCRKRFKSYLKEIYNYCGVSNGKLLDIGSGLGYFLDEARKFGFDACGLDLSQEASEYARTHFNLKIKVANIENDTFRPEEFDIITMWALIEHLPDPNQSLNVIKKWLKPGGKLIISTPNYACLFSRLSGKRCNMIKLPEHLFFFTPKALRMSLESAGLRLDKLNRKGSYYIINYYLVNHNNRPAFLRALRWVPFNLGDSMTFYVTKIQGKA